MHHRVLSAEDDKWTIRPRHVKRALDLAGRSAPGPDGIPFSAYKRLGLLGQNVLFHALIDLTKEGAEKELAVHLSGTDGHCTFNDSLMVFLPKKATGCLAGREYFAPADTRPLSIVNADNRLMASAIRLLMEPILDYAVSPAQQGFLGGRSLLQNVVDVDEGMRKAALLGSSPAAIFFDFKAAFPSLSQSFMITTLSHLGIPRHIIQFIKCLYWDNHCLLSIGGRRFGGFKIGAGIRQGCPLSPLLFAIVADILLRRLEDKFPSALRRAYADDLAMVTTNFLISAKPIMHLFREYQCISGLILNMHKVMVIPLWFPPALRKWCSARNSLERNKSAEASPVWRVAGRVPHSATMRSIWVSS